MADSARDGFREIRPGDDSPTDSNEWIAHRPIVSDGFREIRPDDDSPTDSNERIAHRLIVRDGLPRR